MAEEAEQSRELVFEAGGDEADLGELFAASMADFGKDIGPYLLAGMGQFAVVVPVTFVMVMAIYIGGMFGMFGGWFLSLIATLILANFGDAGILLGMLTMFVFPLIGFLAVFLPILPISVAILAPINASLMRAVAAHQRGEKEMALGSAFDTALQDIFKVIIVGMILMTLSTFGLLFCYVGALVIPILFGFVNSLVVLHGVGPLRALQIQFAHFRKHGNMHLMLGVVQIALAFVAGMIPVVGPMFMLDMHVRAHRKMFGDGAEPVVS